MPNIIYEQSFTSHRTIPQSSTTERWTVLRIQLPHWLSASSALIGSLLGDLSCLYFLKRASADLFADTQCDVLASVVRQPWLPMSSVWFLHVRVMCVLRETPVLPNSLLLLPLLPFILLPLPATHCAAPTYEHIVPFQLGTHTFRPSARELYIAGIMSPDSQGVLLAIDLALRDFNKDRRFFTSVTVKFIFAETKVRRKGLRW